jgi:hypothetical protein
MNILLEIKMTNQELVELRIRNEKRAKKLIKDMGAKWLCHPKNRVEKLSKEEVEKRHFSGIKL